MAFEDGNIGGIIYAEAVEIEVFSFLLDW